MADAVNVERSRWRDQLLLEHATLTSYAELPDEVNEILFQVGVTGLTIRRADGTRTEYQREVDLAELAVQVEPGDPRYCPQTFEHAPHRYEYEYERPEHLGGHTRGSYWCDGIPMFPSS